MPSTNDPHAITLAEAAAMTKRFRDSVSSTATIAFAFDIESIKSLANQAGCDKMRAYPGLDENGDPQLILVGADATGNDIITGTLLERAIKCPQSCSSANPLNSDATS